MGVFADTWFYVSLIDERDRYHDEVSRYAHGLKQRQFTTRWVLAELANLASKGTGRVTAAQLIRRLACSPRVRILSDTDALYDRGLELYERRPDKEWSLTDCISFVVMEREGLREALTNDHHFEQAGFVPVFAGHA